jgi:diaminopimelate epimerase
MDTQNFTYPIAFAKMSGTGNDFIIIDHRDPFIAENDQPEFARTVCRRKFSVGADGLILIEKSDSADFSWQFYNGDGSRAEMCGNGARCAVRFAYGKDPFDSSRGSASEYANVGWQC